MGYWEVTPKLRLEEEGLVRWKNKRKAEVKEVEAGTACARSLRQSGPSPSQGTKLRTV